MWPIIISIYTLMSLAAFVAHWRDKRAARNSTRRTPEKSLHTLELLGGWPGALIARHLFHHKTRKRSYRVVFWGIGAIHIVAWGLVVWWAQR
ncbi:MAG: uncharacterized membrane protein YsdA (DUF1294 family) [Phycisphaerales bacterium]|jgi:uncharacterized membrane protein YsdA (DUF1294 family)